jgi:hypothetical protein
LQKVKHKAAGKSEDVPGLLFRLGGALRLASLREIAFDVRLHAKALSRKESQSKNYFDEEVSSVVAACSSATHETNRRIQFSEGSAICTPTRAVP